MGASARVACIVACLVVGQAACAQRPTIEEGRALFKANGCASCHGAEGHGDGLVGQSLGHRPRDLRDVTAFQGGTSENAIAETLAYGLGPGAEMPRFAHLTDAERRSIALFVISLRGDQHAGLATNGK